MRRHGMHQQWERQRSNYNLIVYHGNASRYADAGRFRIVECRSKLNCGFILGLTHFPDDDNTIVNGSAFASTDERSDRAEINSCQTLTHAYFDLFLCDVYGLFYSSTSLRCTLLPRNSSLLDIALYAFRVDRRGQAFVQT